MEESQVLSQKPGAVLITGTVTKAGFTVVVIFIVGQKLNIFIFILPGNLKQTFSPAFSLTGTPQFM